MIFFSQWQVTFYATSQNLATTVVVWKLRVFWHKNNFSSYFQLLTLKHPKITKQNQPNLKNINWAWPNFSGTFRENNHYHRTSLVEICWHQEWQVSLAEKWSFTNFLSSIIFRWPFLSFLKLNNWNIKKINFWTKIYKS